MKRSSPAEEIVSFKGLFYNHLLAIDDIDAALCEQFVQHATLKVEDASCLAFVDFNFIL